METVTLLRLLFLLALSAGITGILASLAFVAVPAPASGDSGWYISTGPNVTSITRDLAGTSDFLTFTLGAGTTDFTYDISRQLRGVGPSPAAPIIPAATNACWDNVTTEDDGANGPEGWSVAFTRKPHVPIVQLPYPNPGIGDPCPVDGPISIGIQNAAIETTAFDHLFVRNLPEVVTMELPAGTPRIDGGYPGLFLAHYNFKPQSDSSSTSLLLTSSFIDLPLQDCTATYQDANQPASAFDCKSDAWKADGVGLDEAKAEVQLPVVSADYQEAGYAEIRELLLILIGGVLGFAGEVIFDLVIRRHWRRFETRTLGVLKRKSSH